MSVQPFLQAPTQRGDVPGSVVTVGEVGPTGTPAPGGARVAVLASLNLPDQDEHLAALIRQLTRTAFKTLVDVGADPWLVDLTARTRAGLTELGEADALVLLGGGDMDPSLYGYEGEVANEYGVDRDADEYSMAAVRQALVADQPLLAICRGVQVLNVACGGTLHPDLADWSLHRGASHDALFVDEHVTIDPQSRLASWAGSTDLVVRTGHHQAVDRVADELVAVGWADDGLVEAVEHPTSRAVGVQWHPEQESASHADRHRLFAAFVNQTGSALSA